MKRAVTQCPGGERRTFEVGHCVAYGLVGLLARCKRANNESKLSVIMVANVSFLLNNRDCGLRRFMNGINQNYVLAGARNHEQRQ